MLQLIFSQLLQPLAATVIKGGIIVTAPTSTAIVHVWAVLSLLKAMLLQLMPSVTAPRGHATVIGHAITATWHATVVVFENIIFFADVVAFSSIF